MAERSNQLNYDSTFVDRVTDAINKSVLRSPKGGAGLQQRDSALNVYSGR